MVTEGGGASDLDASPHQSRTGIRCVGCFAEASSAHPMKTEASTVEISSVRTVRRLRLSPLRIVRWIKGRGLGHDYVRMGLYDNDVIILPFQLVLVDRI
jgi:hypothetical protein